MTRSVARAVFGLLGLSLVQCGPSASGTKTNWFRECTREADCDDELSCSCGICTLSCTEDAGCEEGHCGTELESSVQCSMPTEARLCVPTSAATCSEYPLEDDPDLGEALTPSCSTESALVCESFDRPLPPEYGTWPEEGMAAAIQDCEVHAGDGAIRYTSPAAGMMQTRIRLPAPVPSGPLHARFFARFAAPMVFPEQLQLFELWETDGASLTSRITVFLTAEGVPRVYVGASDATLVPSAAEPVPRDTWVCLELSLDLQAQNGTAALGVDGTEILSGSGLTTQPAEPFSVVVIEAQPTSDATGVDLYLDELVVATAPIGCQ